MIQLRHTGLYVRDLNKEADFYKNVFKMYSVCEKIEQSDPLVKDLFRNKDISIFVTKLITEQGEKSGIDDMLELLQVNSPKTYITEDILYNSIYHNGCMHLGFGVDNIKKTVDRLIKYGGEKYTDIHVFENGNKCCFCKDPEGNWVELIEKG